MQRILIRPMLLYFGILLLHNPIWGQETTTTNEESSVQYQTDSADAVARRKLMYDLCKQQNGATYIKSMTQDTASNNNNQICFNVEFQCREKGSSGRSEVYQTTRRCLDNSIFEDDGYASGSGNGGVSAGVSGGYHDGYVNGGGNGDGIVITDGMDFCYKGAGCGPCAGKCEKYFNKGKRKKSCIKCLEKNGYYCLASLLTGNRSSCSQGSVKYSCSGCAGGGGGNGGGHYDVDCSVVSNKNCVDYNNGGGSSGGRNSDDCPGCKNNAYPPGTGFLNVMTGLGSFLQGAGAGFGMSGLSSVLGLKQCRKWYENYNKERINTDNPLVDWDCEKYTGVGGLGGLGGGLGGGGFGFNPMFPGNFGGGQWGNMNPYGGLGNFGGGLQINGNLGIGGGLGGGLGMGGMPFTQPWFNQGANGLPYGNQFGIPGAGFQGGFNNFNNPYANPYGNQFGIPGGGFQGGYNPYGNQWGGGGFQGGYPPQGSNVYWEGRMIQEQARQSTGMRYFTPQPINSSWQYGFPR